MRKVKFNKWIDAAEWENKQIPDLSTIHSKDRPLAKPIHETRIFNEWTIKKQPGYDADFKSEGYFHAWFNISDDSYSSVIAVLEDSEGFIHEIPSPHIKFISPPEEVTGNIGLELPGQRSHTIHVDEAEEYGLNSIHRNNKITFRTEGGGTIDLQEE